MIIEWNMNPLLYTFPPRRIVYSYIIVNAIRFNKYFSYIVHNYKKIKSVIIDSGVEIFRDPKVKDYPQGHLEKIVMTYDLVKKYVRQVYAVIPDYPDDYYHKSLWINDRITNIERTLVNVEHALANYSDVEWIIPIQGWNNNPFSIIRCINYYREWGIIKKYDYFAIANLCVSKKCTVIESTVKLAYNSLKTKKLHVFGVAINCLKKIKKYIYSFDSVAYTRPVAILRRNGIRWSAKNEREREQFFIEWIKRAEKYVK